MQNILHRDSVTADGQNVLISQTHMHVHSHTLTQYSKCFIVFIRSHVVPENPGSQFDCAVTEFQPINLMCPGHHLLLALSSRQGAYGEWRV